LADTSAKLFFTAEGPAGTELLLLSLEVSPQPAWATKAALMMIVFIVFFLFIKFSFIYLPD
jgi:hypothetical protein